MRSKQLRLDHVRIDGDTQPRTDIDHNLVDEYASAYLSGVELPPVVVFFDGANYWLADGFHRWWASRKAERKTIACEIRHGMQADAQWFSYAANQTHGLRRSNADKAKAVRSALLHPNCAKMSDGAVAAYLGVSDRMVAKYRAELTPKDSESTTRTGRDGRKIDTARIGKGKAAEPGDLPKLPEQPEKRETKPTSEPAKTTAKTSQFAEAMQESLSKMWAEHRSTSAAVVASVLENLAERVRNGQIVVQ